ncbi:DUF1802 family protein [Methanosphaera stadtmanae]|uniref:DUF1802 family protein n=1 Tax=Methanosphaera stadtmanae TaxID=2317 RepID=UPI002599BE45|nr:DUF1802 family protein [Methanosphaera stadtmanae]
MVKITKCLNDWNATVEALGQGKQTILIRKNSTTLKEFLLYPTVSYANKEDYLDSFKESEKDFVKKNTLPNVEDKSYEVKYYATVEDVFETPVSRIGKFNNYHIWTKKHVSGYFNTKNANIWLLRVYELDEPVYCGRSRGMVFANVNKEIELKGKPVINDKDFKKLKDEILNK